MTAKIQRFPMLTAVIDEENETCDFHFSMPENVSEHIIAELTAGFVLTAMEQNKSFDIPTFIDLFRYHIGYVKLFDLSKDKTGAT